MYLRFAVAFIAMLSFAPAKGAITWNVTYNDIVNNTNVGFDDASLGATRQATFNSVFDYLNTVLDANGTVDLLINNSQTDGTGSLASAGSLFFTSPNGFSNGLVFQHATTGSDPQPGSHEGSATFDFGYTWNSELDTTLGTEFDLFTVALHEVTHALGFSSLVSPAGVSEISGGNPGVFSNFDSFLELGDGTDLFSANGNYDGSAADLISNDVFFNGANAMAANGGSPVKIYAPSPFEPGSSISHVDTATYPTAVMTHAIAMGVEKREYSAIDVGILQDIGWGIQAVPEPSTYAVLAMMGGWTWVRRRRQNQVKANRDAAI